MGFRQKNDLKHKTFMRLYQVRLFEIGMPLRTLESDAWIYLLDHGYCFYTKWTIDHLDKQQLSSLLDIVDNYEEHDGNCGLTLRQQIIYRLEKE
jgi:hypothetical protein